MTEWAAPRSAAGAPTPVAGRVAAEPAVARAWHRPGAAGAVVRDIRVVPGGVRLTFTTVDGLEEFLDGVVAHAAQGGTWLRLAVDRPPGGRP